jgi:hypothetical protein
MRMVFPHYSVVDFQSSVREMQIDGFERVFQRYASLFRSMQMGSIQLEPPEIKRYGRAGKVDMGTGETKTAEIGPEGVGHLYYRVEGEASERSFPFVLAQIVSTAEACFHIEDALGEPFFFSVLYLTLRPGDDDREKTLFWVGERENLVGLSCVAEFWRLLVGVREDLSFSLEGPEEGSEGGRCCRKGGPCIP